MCRRRNGAYTRYVLRPSPLVDRYIRGMVKGLGMQEGDRLVTMQIRRGDRYRDVKGQMKTFGLHDFVRAFKRIEANQSFDTARHAPGLPTLPA